MSLPLIGRYNVSNALAAISATQAIGIDLQTKPNRRSHLHLRPVPGRVESIEIPEDFQLFVDYAHTADALQNVLATVAELDSDSRGRLWCSAAGATATRANEKRSVRRPVSWRIFPS